ncbi:uncharacterized protein LOC125682579 isoform X2 [Ostrea edulis]|nr:uncharacterized protein LOC125682579 isoform X2 [Ostrea edulis]
MAVLRENITAFCNDELGELSRCLQPYDTACQNDSTYQQYVQYFQPSTFGCQGISGLQCDMRAVFRCFTDMDMSLLTSNLTFFCNVELKKALDCVGIYEDVCMKSLYSGSYNSTVSSLEPELYGCSGTSGPQCEFSKAAQCMHDFTAQRMEILDINTASRNFTAECQLLKTAEKQCIAPYENACTNNTSFSSFKEIGKLKDVLCKDLSSSSPRLDPAVTVIVWSIMNICFIMN